MIRMSKLAAVLLALATLSSAADLPKYLNLDAIKTMVAAAEAEAQTRNVRVAICVMDDTGNLLFLQKGDRARHPSHPVASDAQAWRHCSPTR